MVSEDDLFVGQLLYHNVTGYIYHITKVTTNFRSKKVFWCVAFKRSKTKFIHDYLSVEYFTGVMTTLNSTPRFNVLSKMRQKLLKLSTSREQTIKFLKDGVLIDFIIVHQEKNSEFFTGYYYIIHRIPEFVAETKEEYLLELLTDVMKNTQAYGRNGTNSEFCRFFKPEEEEERLNFDRYKPY